MKRCQYIPSLILTLMLASCNADKETNNTGSQQRHEQELKVLSQKLTDAEANGQLKEFLRPFDTDALCMPEYQVTLTGDKEIASYYEEMFKRQHIKTLHRQQQEFIHMKNTIVEIGTFKKEYTTSDVDSLITLEGKYWHVWSVLPNGMYRIKGEAFGYFHSVDLPESLIISTDQRQPGESELNAVQPFELKAYNALMEKGVRQRNAALRAGFFTDDAILFPFADTVVAGMNNIKPYLIAYSSRGTVSINSISCYTYAFEDLDNYILEYDMFKVEWSRPDVSGRTEGKGIRIWKRQEDKSLRLFREIGTHNLL